MLLADLVAKVQFARGVLAKFPPPVDMMEDWARALDELELVVTRIALVAHVDDVTIPGDVAQRLVDLLSVTTIPAALWPPAGWSERRHLPNMHIPAWNLVFGVASLDTGGLLLDLRTVDGSVLWRHVLDFKDGDPWAQR